MERLGFSLPNRTYTLAIVNNIIIVIEDFKNFVINHEDYYLEKLNEVEDKNFKYLNLSNNKNIASFGILDASKTILKFNGDLNNSNNFMSVIEFYAETLKGSTEVDSFSPLN